MFQIKGQSKDGKEEKVFDALEWLAAMCSHVPNKGLQMVRYVGFYSNVARGKRKKNDQDELIPSILEPDGPSGEYKRNWARLIQKIYEVDPLICPRCSGKMKVISIIERPEIVKKILQHLSLWGKKARPPPKTRPLKSTMDTSDSQLPSCEDHLYCDPEYPIEAYVS
jgi:putative transposase